MLWRRSARRPGGDHASSSVAHRTARTEVGHRGAITSNASSGVTGIFVERERCSDTERSLIVGASTGDLEHAGHRRERALRQAHAGRQGHYLGTLIHHKDDRRCAPAQLTTTSTANPPTTRRTLVRGTCQARLGLPSRQSTRIPAVGLPVKAGTADREHAQAGAASLEAKQLVHRSPTATTNLPRPPTPSIVCSKPASIG